jgi:histidinol dehydrogenase
MKPERLEWGGDASVLADELRLRMPSTWSGGSVDVSEIERAIVTAGDRDAVVLDLTARYDATASDPESLGLRVERAQIDAAVEALDPALRESLETAATNVRAVAEAQVGAGPGKTTLPQGQEIEIREVPVAAAAVYAPGGRATYPSSVLMGAIPARAAGVERLVLASPPGPDGKVSPLVLAAAQLCGVEEIYAMGGAQAIFALAFGTESVPRVDVIVGPGNDWVQEAKRAVSGRVGIDSYAGPSELMVIAGHDADPEWIALDLCAQAEHGVEGPLIVAAVEDSVLGAVEEAVGRVERTHATVARKAKLFLVAVPDAEAAIELANAFAPEHLELLEEDAALLANRVTTAGCVFAGRHSATAFGDYVAGSNHVLPTGGAGRFSGPLGPDVFRRKIATVQVSEAAAAKLAPHVDAIARAEGFPVHGESAMIRVEGDRS